MRKETNQENSVALAVPEEQAAPEEQMAGEQQPAKENPSSEGWRFDIVAFDTYLGELAGKGRVPDEPSLAKRVTIIPGDEETNSEVLPVTAGDGGYADMTPAEDTVQFQVNEALKGKSVKWEFELARDAAKSFDRVARLIPNSVSKENANPFLAALIIDTTAELDFKAGDIVNLEATIGDASQNKGIGGLRAPSGPVAVYHLESTPHPMFWIGLTNVKMSGPTRKTTPRLEPAPEVTAFAKDLIRACMLYDEKALNTLMLLRCSCSLETVYSILGSKSPAKCPNTGCRHKVRQLFAKSHDKNKTATRRIMRVELLFSPKGRSPVEAGASFYPRRRVEHGGAFQD